MLSAEQAPSTARPSPRRAGHRQLVLVGLGGFLVAIGLLLRFYAAPRLVAAPTNLYLTLTLKAPGSSYFNEGTLTSTHNATLAYNLTIRGNPADSTSKLAVWDSYAALSDPKTGAQVNSTYQRAVFDRRTGELQNCCGASVNDDTTIRQHGIGTFWPIGTRKTTYQVFDVNGQSAWPATYSGTARIQGITVYRFTQHIPSTLVAQMAGVPLSLLGVHKTGNVVANRYYQADNTFWIDPRTGVLIDTDQRILSVLHGPGGEGKLIGAQANLKMTPASQRALASLANKNAAQIALVRQTGPLGGIVVGLILILAGTIPFRRSRRAASRRRRRARAREALAAGEVAGDDPGKEDPGEEGPTEQFGSPAP
jgi:hypothetical protein